MADSAYEFGRLSIGASNPLGDSGPDHVSDSGPSQVVKQPYTNFGLCTSAFAGLVESLGFIGCKFSDCANGEIEAQRRKCAPFINLGS